MPPPGGYANLPWRRNIPTRGFGFVGCLVFGSLYYFFSDVNNRTRRGQWRREMKLEAENLDMACMPLYEAEIDRDELRSLKHLIECKGLFVIDRKFLEQEKTNLLSTAEAVNIVASGFDPSWKCGGYGIGDNGNGAYWPSNGFKSPYNMEVTKNTIGGDRWTKNFTPAHAQMSM